jgi:hypothetical protein
LGRGENRRQDQSGQADRQLRDDEMREHPIRISGRENISRFGCMA